MFYTRVVFVFGHFERLVIFDDELAAVSALSRSDLKMAERPQAKLRCKVRVDCAKTKFSCCSYSSRSTI